MPVDISKVRVCAPLTGGVPHPLRNQEEPLRVAHGTLRRKTLYFSKGSLSAVVLPTEINHHIHVPVLGCRVESVIASERVSYGRRESNKTNKSRHWTLEF